MKLSKPKPDVDKVGTVQVQVTLREGNRSAGSLGFTVYCASLGEAYRILRAAAEQACDENQRAMERESRP